MNLKQAAGFAVLAGIGVALTAGTVATAVAGSGSSGGGDATFAGPEPVFPAPDDPFASTGAPELGQDGDTGSAEPAPNGTDETPADAAPSTDPDEPGSEPGRSASADASGSGEAESADPAPSSSPTRSGTGITAPYTDGYLPPNWIRGVTVACGSPVTDLPDGDPDLTTEITGPYEPGTGTLPVTLTGTVGSDDILGAPVLVWSQDDVIVDMGLGWHEADFTVAEALAGPGEWSGPAIAPPFSTCQEDTDTTAGMGLQYDNERAAGTYEVRVVTLHTMQQGGGGRLEQLEVSEPVEVTVD